MSSGNNADNQPDQKLVLRPIVGLAENLPKGDLERITIDAILRHRQLRDEAEERCEQCQTATFVDPRGKTVGPARIAYIVAMIDVHAQQTVLSTLLDVLGYVPLTSVDKSL
ncbi:transcriptional repressor TraM [Phyllobacterium endophyticum]|nr:transcriptional repressor TraM [Phyllobacterium endophyticum]MBB3237071.1 hypothetical protein [Phyllobacterium endophyticum]